MLKRLRHRILPLTWLEFSLGMRGGGAALCLVLCAIAGFVAGSADGMTPGLAAYRVGRLAALLVGFVCLPLVAAAARRDPATKAQDVIQSRAHLAHELLLARWLGNLGTAVAMLLVLCLFAFGAQAFAAAPPAPEAGARFSLVAIGQALAVGLLPLVFLSALAYCLVEILQNVLASAVIAVYWLLVMLGRDYVARILDFSLTQNAAVYLLLSAGLVLLAMSVARYRQGLSNARRANLPVLAGLFLAAGVVLGWQLVMTRHDPPMHSDQVAVAVAGQHLGDGRLPGFWLPDQHGRMVRLADYAGKPLVVGLWSPAVPDSVGMLADLERLHRSWSSKGVGVVAVCLASDWYTGGRYARAQGLSFPVVTDDGTHWGEEIKSVSPLAEAYDLTGLPAIFVADGDRMVANTVAGGTTGAGAESTLQRLLPDR